MGKLRNANTEVGKFTEWLGRKCRNHNPLQELGLTKKMPNMYKSKTKGDLKRSTGGDEGTLVYRANGRVFRVRVDEISEDTAYEMEMNQSFTKVKY